MSEFFPKTSGYMTEINRVQLLHNSIYATHAVVIAGCTTLKHARGCTALSLPSICFFLAHIVLALFQIMALTKDEEALIVERRDEEEHRHFVTSHHLEKMTSESSA